jgi:glycosyltransferase involved in cell wall biosynthesis
MLDVRLSIIMSVYQSYDIVRRQMLHFKNMDLPEDIEIIIVDDGSNPPIPEATLQTHNKRGWTQGLGRNMGAEHAKGKYFLMTDIDHILSKELIMFSREYDGDRMMFPRYFGVLLEDGSFTQDEQVLRDYGLAENRFERDGKRLYASVHANTFTIKRETFEALNGYDPAYCNWGYHPESRTGDDVNLNKRWNAYAKEAGVKLDMGPPVYMFPIGRFHKDGDLNPGGLFNNLSREPKEVFKP